MDAGNPPDAGSPARVERVLVIAVSAAVVTVVLGVVTAVLLFGLLDGNGTNATRPPIDRTSSGVPTVSPTATPSGTTSPTEPAEPSPRVTVVIPGPATDSADTVLGAMASTGTLLAGVGTLLAAVAALRTTRAAGAGRQRGRAKGRRR